MSKRFAKIIFTISIVGFLFSYTPAKSNFNNIDSLKNDISNYGFAETSLERYIFYLVNNPINVEAENKFLNNLNIQSNELTLARIILLKKESRFKEAYNLAAKLLNQNFTNYLFFEELVFLAQVNNKIETLKKEVGEFSNKKFIDGLINYNEGNYSEAKKIFSELIKKAKSKEFYYWLAYSERYLGNYPESLVNLNKIKNVINIEDPFYAKILNALGGLYYLSGEYNKAEKFYKEAYAEALKSGNNVELIKANINLAIINDESGEIYNARKKLSTAQLLAEEINALKLLAIVHSELGVSYTYDTQLTKAEEHYSEALEIYKSINESTRLSTLYNNLGKIYLSLFNYPLALEYFNNGLKVAGDDVKAKILNLTQIADVYTNLANYSEAYKYYTQARELAKQVKSVPLEFEVEMGLGMLDFNLGKFSESLKVFKDAKELVAEHEHPYLFAEANHKIGIVYNSLDSLQLAENFLISSMNLFEKHDDIYSQLLVEYDLTDLWLKTNQFKKAKDILNINRKILETYELDYLLSLNYLFNAKIAVEEKNYNAAKIMLNKAINIGEKISNDNLIIEATYSLAKLNILIDDKNHVEKLLLSLKKMIESRSLSLISNSGVQISYFASFDEIYNTIFNFYLVQNNLTKAFEVLDLSRSRNTMQNITTLKLSSSKPEILKNYLELNWKIKSNLYTNGEKDSLEYLIDDLRNEILKLEPELQKYLAPMFAKTVTEIQNEINDSTLFLSIHAIDDFTHLFLIGSDRFEYLKQYISRAEIFKLLAEISPYYSQTGFAEELIFNQDLFSFNIEKANELYEKLFKSIFKFIDKDKNLIVSTSDVLLNFPIESLACEYNKNFSPYSFNDTKFLVEDYNITYAPSANIYFELQKIGSNDGMGNLLVGDPIVSNNDFYINFRSSLLRKSEGLDQLKLNPLEFSKEEIQSINSIVGNSVKFTSDEATELNFKKHAPTSNIIHISSHSFLLNKEPFIVFSDGEGAGENGFLDVGEILQLKLNSDLVVLSSCKSGLGEIDKREGILGMQKAFFDAGAKSVVVSLWDVNDKYTYLFMELFYKNLKNGLSKSFALKRAKQDFIKEYSPNPYYWAAFVLAGNTDGIKFKEDEAKINLTYLFILLFVISLFYFGKKSFIKSKQK